MKIAIFLPGLPAGGVERLHLVLASSLAAHGHDVVFVLQRAFGDLLDQVPAGLRVVSLDQPKAILSVLPLARFLRRERPDAVMAAQWQNNLVAIWAAALAGGGTRVIAGLQNNLSSQVRHGPAGAVRFAPFLYRRFLPRATAIVAASKGVAEDVAGVTGIDGSRIRVIYNSVVPPDLGQRIADAPDHPWLQPHQQIPVVIGVGRLVKQKSFDVLIKGFRRLRDRRPARLIILGQGPLEPELRALIGELSLQDDVALAGFVANPYSFMARAQVFALSSIFEGFGNVVVEALACGTQVVSTDCPHGPSEILDGGRYGRLVPVGDAEAFGEALSAAIDAPLPRPVLYDRGRHFSAEKATAAYLALLDEVVSPGSARPALAVS